MSIEQDVMDWKTSIMGSTSYVSNLQAPFLFRSCLYAVMDAIRWYNDLMNKLIEDK